MGILALIAICYFPGVAVLLMIRTPKTWFDLGILPFAFGFLVNTLFICGLTLIHSYTPSLWIGTIAGFTLLALPSLIIRKRKVLKIPTQFNWKLTLGQVVVFLLAIGFYRTPSEWLLHYGMDASNYMNQAAYQLSKGTAFIEDFHAEKYHADFPKAEFQVNSFGGRVNPEGKREFFFPPLWKQALSIPLYLAGQKVTFYLAGILALFTGVIFGEWVFLSMGSPVMAVLGSALLTLSPVVIQYMKLPMSEVFFLFCTVFTLMMLKQSLRDSSIKSAVTAGILISLTYLIKADAVLLLPGFVLATAILYLDQRKNKAQIKTVDAFAISMISSTWIAWELSLYLTRYYIVVSYTPGFIKLVSIGLPALLVGLIAFSRIRDTTRQKALERLNRILDVRLFQFVAMLLVVYFGVLLFVRGDFLLPLMKTYWPAKTVKLENFFFPTDVAFRYATLPLTITGVAATVYFTAIARLDVLTWLAPFVMISMLGTFDLFHSNFHYWASRRFITSLIPLLIIATLFLGEHFRKKGFFKGGWTRQVGIAWLGVIACAYGVHNYLINYRSGSDWRGIVSQVKPVAGVYNKSSDIVVLDSKQGLSDALQIYLTYTLGVETLSFDFATVTDEELIHFYGKMKTAGNRLLFDNLTPQVKSRITKLFQGRFSSMAADFTYSQPVHLNPFIIESVRSES